MSTFSAPVDICNRALQIIGASRISSMTDGSKEASEMNFAYDKLRQAELRRNAWRFALRRAALRLIDDDSYIITPPAYSASNTYGLGYLVTYSSQIWQSMVASNLANTPGSNDNWEIYAGPLVVGLFDSTNEYLAGELTYVTTPAYLALTSGLSTTPPTSDWLALTSATITGLTNTILYPLSSGTDAANTTRNIYRLPNGFLRLAPQDPKSSGGGPANDWLIESNYLITAEIYPIVLRFVADVTRVSTFDPMFCEGLAGRLGFELCEIITQSTAKKNLAWQTYQSAIAQARLTNGIEVGSDQPPEDEWISVRG